MNSFCCYGRHMWRDSTRFCLGKQPLIPHAGRHILKKEIQCITDFQTDRRDIGHTRMQMHSDQKTGNHTSTQWVVLDRQYKHQDRQIMWMKLNHTKNVNSCRCHTLDLSIRHEYKSDMQIYLLNSWSDPVGNIRMCLFVFMLVFLWVCVGKEFFACVCEGE